MTNNDGRLSRPAPEALPAPNDEIVLTPHDIGVSGGGIGRVAGMAVFLDRGLPGDTLLCRVTERKPRFLKAEVLEVLTPSPDAAPAFCPYGGVCGGCAWTTLAYPAQLAWKERQVKETLRRVGKVPFRDADGAGAEYLSAIPSPRVLGYRNKMEFAFGLEDGEPALGLRRRNSHAVVSIAECPLSAMPVKNLLAAARDWMAAARLPVWDGGKGYLRFLVLRCPDYSPDGAPRCLAECVTTPGGPDAARSVAELGDILMRAGATGFVHSTRKDKANVAYGERAVLSRGETAVTEKTGPLLLRAPVQAFLQANTAASALLYDQVRQFAYPEGEDAPKTIWDAYSGVGGIALSLAGDTRVLGIESVRAAVDFAEKNAGANGLSPSVSFRRGDAAAVLTAADPAPDLVVADPPRAGLSREFTDALLRVKPRRFIAVSCDPGSLARDLALLLTAYDVRTVRAVDMFPHTPHVETVCLLVRKT